MSFYINGYSFKLKTIMPTFADFNRDLTANNYFTDYLVFSENHNKILYSVLMTYYCNAYCRQDMPELFYLDLINIVIRVYNKYFKIFDTIDKIYNDDVDLLKGEVETTTETNGNTSSSTATSRSADTPTVVNPDAQFDDSYTNVASTSKANSQFDENRQRQTSRDYNKVDAANKVMSLSDMPIDEFAQEFASLFVQIDNPTIDYIYNE